MKQFIAASIVIIFLIVSCNDKPGKDTGTALNDSITNADRKKDSLEKALTDSLHFAKNKDSVLLQLTDSILLTLKNKNFSTFTNYIHPSEGVRFSPYGYIDTVKHIRFTRSEFTNQLKQEDQALVWGEFDGTGYPLKMTLDNYMEKFVYDVDFLNPEKRTVNKFIGSGNSLNNLSLIYKNSDFTESHFSGFEEKYGGMEWRTLRLVFKEHNQRFYLVGVVHDQWTS